MTIILFKKLRPSAEIPQYATLGAAGMDVHADFGGLGLDPSVGPVITMPPGATLKVPTGIAVAIPVGFEIQVRPRSGLAAKYGVTVLNSPGTIDSDYRGEIAVLLINHGSANVEIKHGDRIAQLVVARVETAVLREVEILPVTERGTGGFGSTGRGAGHL